VGSDRHLIDLHGKKDLRKSNTGKASHEASAVGKTLRLERFKTFKHKRTYLEEA
jgi:hypothetical protein